VSLLKNVNQQIGSMLPISKTETAMNENEKLVFLNAAKMRAAGNPVDPMEAWERNKPQPEPPRRERGLDTPPVDIDAHVSAIVAAEREFIMTVVGQAMKELGEDMMAEVSDRIKEQVEKIRSDFGLKATVEEMVKDALANKGLVSSAKADETNVVTLPNFLQSQRGRPAG
jgi:hypothetical protein